MGCVVVNRIRVFSTASSGGKCKRYGSVHFGGIYGAGEPPPPSQSDSVLRSRLFSNINTRISAVTFDI